jgi:hypothetical protein
MAAQLLVMSLGLLLLEPPLPCRTRENAAPTIDRLMATARAKTGARPTYRADNPEFVRRIYLDLIGRIPTHEETRRFLDGRQPDKRARLIEELLAGGEFALHWRENLHVWLTGELAFTGDAGWRAWLETALKQNRPWDDMVRTILRARPGKPEDAGAAHFLTSRLAQGPSGLDRATRDVSRLFFGVDIQCARCHKHPEVELWKQESYWGMAAFFNRSYPITVQGKVYLAERAAGDISYPRKGKPQVARPQFLTGETLAEPAAKPAAAPKSPAAAPAEDPADYLVAPETAAVKTRVPVPKFSRREQFIARAVNSKDPYFKRAIVNYVWAQLLGRGLVEPLDQMHDGNPASHPEVLAFLADDFVAHQFDLRHLIRGIVNSRTYQLASRYPADRPRPAEATYSYSSVRPLAAHQLAMSLLVATGYYEAFRAGADAKTRADAGLLRARWEAHARGMLAGLVKDLDAGSEPFQPGVREALFQANNAGFAGLVAKGSLVQRLAGIKDDAALVKEVFWCVLARAPTKEEMDRLGSYLRARSGRRAAACEQMVWALVTSAEFRFNH